MIRQDDPADPVPWRTATPADIPELVRVINAAYRVEDFFVTGDRTDAADVQARMARPGACFLVLEAPGGAGLRGAVHVTVHGARGHFGLLSVDPRHQGQGLGRALVSLAERYCRAAGCLHLDLDVVNLREELPGFYQSLGYALTGQTSPLAKPATLTRPAHLVRMTKPLAG